MSIKDTIGSQPHLFEARGIEIEAAQRPQHREAGLACKPGGDSGSEQGCSSVVAQRGRRRCKFMQAGAVETIVCEPVVKPRQPERQRWPALALGLRELRAKRG